MQRIDMLIAAVVVLAAIGSVVGAVAYEDDRLGAPFLVTWQTREVALGPVEDSATAGETVEIPLDMDVRNLTTLDLTVTITGPQVAVEGAQAFVELLPPDANASVAQQEETLSPGPQPRVQIPLSVTLREAPATASVRAASPQAAVAQLDATEGSDEGRGTWTLRVSIARAGPGALPATTFTITVEGTARAYEAEATPEAPDVGR